MSDEIDYDDPRNGLPTKDEPLWPLVIVLTLTILVLVVGVILMIGSIG